MDEQPEESLVWKGGPSQWTNFWGYVFAAVLAAVVIAGGVFFPPLMIALVVPLGVALWRFLVVRCEVYELTEQRLRFFSGVFSRQIHEIELYRIKDSTVHQPFLLRIFRLGTVSIDTSDRSHPRAELVAVADPVAVREHLRRMVERLRELKRVREVDFDGGEGSFEVN